MKQLTDDLQSERTVIEGMKAMEDVRLAQAAQDNDDDANEQVENVTQRTNFPLCSQLAVAS